MRLRSDIAPSLKLNPEMQTLFFRGCSDADRRLGGDAIPACLKSVGQPPKGEIDIYR